MFRRLLVLACALAFVGALSWGATAAPISGSFGVDIVFYPQGPVVNKVDLIDMKFEADLILTLSISGLDITSTTVFTFLGVEFQSFVISATVGALTIKDTIIFSPTFFEFEETRDQYGRKRWCLFSSLPSTLNVAPATCNIPSGALNGYIFDSILSPSIGRVYFWQIFGGYIHPLVQNLVLARWLDPTNALNNQVQFRKKIADLSLNIAGLVLNVRALFANVNTTANINTMDLQSGLVLAMEGKTVSGVGVRGELWLGAKQGLECFGECKPLERFFNQMVTGGGFTNWEEEKVFLNNVVIAGVRNDFRAEFHFTLAQCSIDQVDNDDDGWFSEDPADGVDNDGDALTDEDGINITNPLCFMSLTQTFVVAPWRLNVQTTWNWNGNFDLISNTTNVQLKFGDMSAVAYFIWRNSAQRAFTPGLAEFVTTFDPPGLQVTSDVTFCTNPVYCGASGVDADLDGLIDEDPVNGLNDDGDCIDNVTGAHEFGAACDANDIPLIDEDPPAPSGTNALQPAFLPPVLSHSLSFTGTVGPMSIAALVIFDGGLLGDFAELDVDMSFTAGPVSVVVSTVLLTNQLGGVGISLSTKF